VRRFRIPRLTKLSAAIVGVAVIAVAGVSAAGGYALASDNTYNGTVVLCWSPNSSHTPTAWKAPYNCPNGDVQATLNAQGAVGPQGPQGPAGPQGKQGPQGIPGPAGKAGTNGTNGTDGLAGAVYRYNNYPSGISPGGIATVECGDTDAVSETYIAVAGGVEVGSGSGFPTTSDLASTSQSLPVAASFPGVVDWNTNSPDPGRLDGWIVQTEVGYDANDTSATVWALCVPAADSGSTSVPVQQDNNPNG
jgi:hypothetical protein